MNIPKPKCCKICSEGSEAHYTPVVSAQSQEQTHAIPAEQDQGALPNFSLSTGQIKVSEASVQCHPKQARVPQVGSQLRALVGWPYAQHCGPRVHYFLWIHPPCLPGGCVHREPHFTAAASEPGRG